MSTDRRAIFARLPRDLSRQVRDEAVRRGSTINAFVENALRAELGELVERFERDARPPEPDR